MRRAILAPALLLAGCTLGPHHVAPGPPPRAAGAFVESGDPAVLAGAPLSSDWWRLFADPALDRLVERALARNTEIRIALANLAEARAILREAGSQRFPATELGASYSRQRVGASAAGTTGAPGSGSASFDLFQIGFDAAYELDLFGRVSRSVEAARGDAQAARAGVEAARVAIAAETARTYALACGFAEQEAVARETAALQAQTLALTQRLLDAGSGTRRDVDRAQQLAEEAAALIPSFAAERRATLYALAALTGDPPADVDRAASACAVPPRVKSLIPVGDGAALLRRRPDIARAERALAAATARIGIATAELYPSIQLLGSISLGATEIGSLTDSSAFGYSLGPLISWSFPNLSAARARLDQAEARADAALAQFDGTVLIALQEAEQALARYGGALVRNAALRRSAEGAANAARLTRLRFDSGADSFLELLDAERSRAATRGALAQSNADVAEAQVALFKALGGGWSEGSAELRLIDIGPD